MRKNTLVNPKTWSEVLCQTKLMEEDFCYKCGEIREPLTPLLPSYYLLPCWECIGDRKTDRADQTNNILRNIKDFYGMILGDRFYHLFISDPLYYDLTIPHSYDTFKKVLSKLSLPSRNDPWFLSFSSGYPKMICEENIEGIEIKNLKGRYEITQDKDFLKIPGYTVYPPEQVQYDPKHHYRYSLFNTTSERKTKRLKIGEKCIKFYDKEGTQDCKTFFQVVKDGEGPVPVECLKEQEIWVIKIGIMRNRGFMKLLFDSLLEILKSVSYYTDEVFLKNRVLISPDKDKNFRLGWTLGVQQLSNDYINLSIL